MSDGSGETAIRPRKRRASITNINQYDLGKSLGEGSFGKVKLGRDASGTPPLSCPCLLCFSRFMPSCARARVCVVVVVVVCLVLCLLRLGMGRFLGSVVTARDVDVSPPPPLPTPPPPSCVKLIFRLVTL